LGANELITDTTSAFTQSAIRIAGDPQLLAQLKEKIASACSSSPLFNTHRFTAHIEATYTAIWERHQRGESPSSFAVPPLASK
jgi:predicted O-linked N-acetylglucosamine transferase (SPINDLY family)